MTAMGTETYTCTHCGDTMGIAGGYGSDEDWEAQDYFDAEIQRHESGECCPEHEPTVIERTAPRVWREVDVNGWPRATRPATEAWARCVAEAAKARKPRIGGKRNVLADLRSVSELARVARIIYGSERFALYVIGEYAEVRARPLGPLVTFRAKVGAA